MKTLAFAVDVDGVIADFTKAVIPIINWLGLGPLPMDYEPSDWDWSDVLSPHDWTKIWERIVVTPNFWLHSPAYRETVRPLALTLTGRAGRDLGCYFVTNRRETNGQTLLWQCNSWLEMVLGDSADWSCIISPYRARKQAILEGLELRALLDDHPDTVRECLYTHAYLLDRPWNRAPEYQDLPRLYSMEEYLDVVRELQARLG